jgi:hypothetical protein
MYKINSLYLVILNMIALNNSNIHELEVQIEEMKRFL